MKRRSRNYFAFKKGTGFFGLIPTINRSKQAQYKYEPEITFTNFVKEMITVLKNTKQ